jgi:hypothetical protein
MIKNRRFFEKEENFSKKYFCILLQLAGPQCMRLLFLSKIMQVYFFLLFFTKE